MMAQLQSPPAARGNPDVVVVGGGVFGLWAARHAIREGRSVLVCEKDRVGAGASGGFVGALMPHMPDRWNTKKQNQFEALVTLESEVALLEAESGLSCGYRRCGRLMPISSARALDAVGSRIAGASRNWPGFRMEHWQDADQGPAQGWLCPEVAPFGVQWDDLSARISPRRYLAALSQSVRRGGGEIREGARIVGLAQRSVSLADGGRIHAGEIIVACGWQAYGLLQPWFAAQTGGNPAGRGVKGQAILLRHEASDRPLIYADGCYAVPHDDGTVAVGASTVENWQSGPFPDPAEFDPGDTAFLEKARRLAPVLRGTEVLERWAGVRPRNMLETHHTEPYCGPVPGLEGVSARTGGFKTGFAMAHWLR